MLKNLFEPLNEVMGPRLSLGRCESYEDESAGQNTDH